MIRVCCSPIDSPSSVRWASRDKSVAAAAKKTNPRRRTLRSVSQGDGVLSNPRAECSQGVCVVVKGIRIDLCRFASTVESHFQIPSRQNT